MLPLLYQGQHQSLQNNSAHASTFTSGATPLNSEHSSKDEFIFISGAITVTSEQQPTCLHFNIRGNTSPFRTTAHMPPLLYQWQHQSLQNSSTDASTFISGATPGTSEQQHRCLYFYIRGNTCHSRTAAHIPPLLYQGQHQLIQNSTTHPSTFISGATPVNSEQQHTSLHFYIRGNTS